MIRTRSAAVKFLEKYIPNPMKKHPGKLGLFRMECLVKFLRNPQNSFKSIHVGGTSGKGSTATIIASILSTKYKTGLHTSPHLVRVNERFRILTKTQNSNINSNSRLKIQKNNTEEISDEEFVDLVQEIKPAALEMEKSHVGAPSYFEIITAMAFLYFKKQKVEIAVIEVGMGGRWDATNVIKPEVAVLTNVGLDHTEILGETVEEIAKDKVGIIKPGVQVVTGVKQATVIELVELTSKNHELRMSLLGKVFSYKINNISENGSYFDYFGELNYKNLFIPMLGEHQVENSVLAIRAVEELGGFSEEEIGNGLKNAFMPGRLEIVRKNPLILLDGAHNPDKMRALVESIKIIWPGKKVKLIMAIKEDKKADEILKLVLPISSEIILTRFESLLDQGKVISYSPRELRTLIEKCGFNGVVQIIDDFKKAVETAKKSADPTDIILVTGSLYLVGKVRKFIK